MYKIITNNSKVLDEYMDAEYVNGSFRDVLIKTRNYIHLGYSFVQHPLPASIRMLFSPVRTVILSTESDGEKSTIMIEKAIEKYDYTLGNRFPDKVNEEDYKVLDFSLTQKAIGEIVNFVQTRR